MTKLGRERLMAALVLAGALVMPVACKRSSAESGVPGAGQGAVAKASTPAAGDSVRGGATAVAAAGTHTLLFIGTSLTAGLGLEPDSAYPQLIQEKIESAHLPFEVVNAGLSGETTAGLLRRLDWLLKGNFDVVVVETGANDGLRGTPVATVKENLRTIVSKIRAARPQARVLLVQMEAPPNLGPGYTQAFHALYADVAKETGATLIPFLLQGVAGERDLNQADGIHPNQRGEHIVADNVWRSIEPVLRQAATGL
ncbi:MAG TPA: arylesterase [Gemmatimonadaceae bacterium]|nr:arylesterase [Gemmatimonadaceae bacterium]